MRILICSNDAIHCLHLKQVIDDILKRSNTKCEVNSINDTEYILREAVKTDAVFLNMGMLHAKDMDIGRKIKSENKKCHIIAMADTDTDYKKAFIISAERLLTSNFEAQEVEEMLKYVMIENAGTEDIECYKNRLRIFIKQKDIRYIEAYNSSVLYYTDTERYRNEISLSGAMSIVENSGIFYRINRQYIVNMMWIDDYEKGNIHISDRLIKVSRRRKGDFERIFMAFKMKSY